MSFKNRKQLKRNPVTEVLYRLLGLKTRNQRGFPTLRRGSQELHRLPGTQSDSPGTR